MTKSKSDNDGRRAAELQPCRLQPERISYSELLLRESDPHNLESPFATLDERITRTERFFIRSHFRAPSIDPSSYRLSLRGTLRGEMDFSLEDLLALPSVTRTVTLECAGNGRILLSPQEAGVQWHLGAIGTAEWTGVPLQSLLETAGIRPDAKEVVFEGADSGRPRTPPRPPRPIAYAHSVPLSEAGRVLLAWEMNGKPLSLEHGFPLRAVVSGYYAMASVKWLTCIHVVAEAFQGYFQTTDYAFWDEIDGLAVRLPLSTMGLKSSIARPVSGSVISAGSTITVFGAAWTGGAPVERIEISANGGDSWHDAEILDPHVPGVWRRWQWIWNVPVQPGAYTLMSRASDRDGNVQPVAHDPRFGSYRIHHIIPVPVTVAS